MNGVFVGQVLPWANTQLPEGWLPCNGASLSINQYPWLYRVIGNEYGGQPPYFNLPNLQGQAVTCAGYNYNLMPWQLGQTMGTSQEQLNYYEMPAHSHNAVINSLQVDYELIALADEGNTNMPNPSLVPASPLTPGSADNNDFDAFLYNMDTNPQGFAGEVAVSVGLNAGSIKIGATGGTQPHNNMMPYISLYYIICYEGPLAKSSTQEQR